MQKPYKLLFDLQKMVVDMALIDRNHHLPDVEKAEDNIVHSFAVAMLCWYIYDLNKLDLDLTKIMKYALIHDFTELYTGDFNTFANKKDRDMKLNLDKLSVKKLEKDLIKFPDMAETIVNYESMNDEESRFVWTVDKMQALILGYMDNWRPYKKINVSYDQFVKKHAELLSKSSIHCRVIYENVLDYCKYTYYDNPVKNFV